MRCRLRDLETAEREVGEKKAVDRSDIAGMSKRASSNALRAVGVGRLMHLTTVAVSTLFVVVVVAIAFGVTGVGRRWSGMS